MVKLPLKLTMFFLVPALFGGCLNEVNQHITEETHIKNLTGQDLTLKVCKIPFKQISNDICPVRPKYEQKEINISAQQSGTYIIGQFIEKVYRGATQGEVDVRFADQIFLTSANYTDVILCRDNQDPVNVIFIPLNGTCPIAFTPQVSPVDDCESTKPIGKNSGTLIGS